RSQEAIEWGRQALPLLQRFGLRDQALLVRSRIAGMLCTRGDLSGLDESRIIAREAGDPERGFGSYAAVVALGNLGSLETWFGAGPAAGVDRIRAAFELASRRGLDRPAHWDLAGLAEPLYDLGRWDEVLRVHEEVAQWEEKRGQSVIGIIAPPFAARILAARGNPAGASALVQEFLPRARELQDSQFLLPAL